MRRPLLLTLAALAVAGVLLLVYVRVLQQSEDDCVPRGTDRPRDRDSSITC